MVQEWISIIAVGTPGWCGTWNFLLNRLQAFWGNGDIRRIRNGGFGVFVDGVQVYTIDKLYLQSFCQVARRALPIFVDRLQRLRKGKR